MWNIEPLISADEIHQRVEELGSKITNDFLGRDLVVVGVLTGASIFLADLVRHINLPLEIDFVAASSYGSGMETIGEVRLLKDLGHSIKGKSVLVVEDICDTGLTLKSLLDLISARGPKSLDVCTLLGKPSRRKVDVPVKYCGFEIEDQFVVGYGLDHAGLHRNLPYIGILTTV